MKADDATKQIPVLVSGMANTRNSPGALGDVSALLDRGNMHCYPGGLNPLSGGWGISLVRAIEEERKVCSNKPIIVTETGYHNCVEQKGHPGVPEDVAAKYLPRLFLHYFNLNIQRTFSYEFIDLKPDSGAPDMERHFGLLRNSGQPKPAFTALQRLIAIAKDPGEPVSGAAEALKFALAPAPVALEVALLQKRDKTLLLFLWKEELSYDVKTRKPIPVAPTDTVLKLERHFAHIAVLRLEAATSKSFDGQDELPLSIDDAVTVIELK